MENELGLEGGEHETCDKVDEDDGAEEAAEDSGEAFAWGYCSGWGVGMVVLHW